MWAARHSFFTPYYAARNKKVHSPTAAPILTPTEAKHLQAAWDNDYLRGIVMAM